MRTKEVIMCGRPNSLAPGKHSWNVVCKFNPNCYQDHFQTLQLVLPIPAAGALSQGIDAFMTTGTFLPDDWETAASCVHGDTRLLRDSFLLAKNSSFMVTAPGTWTQTLHTNILIVKCMHMWGGACSRVCACMCICRSEKKITDVLLYHSSPYFLEAGFLTENLE